MTPIQAIVKTVVEKNTSLIYSQRFNPAGGLFRDPFKDALLALMQNTVNDEEEIAVDALVENMQELVHLFLVISEAVRFFQFSENAEKLMEQVYRLLNW